MPGKDLSNATLSTLRLGNVSPEDRIARHFSLWELSKSDVAQRHGIDNRIVDDATLRAAINLARTVMDPIRIAHGPFIPNSVFRTQALERVLKNRPSSWLSTSQHTLGCACDVEIPNLPTLDLARWAAEHLPNFDQIICECYDPRKGPNSGWVHISVLPPGAGINRHQSLSYVVDPGTGRLAYVNGFQASVA